MILLGHHSPESLCVIMFSLADSSGDKLLLLRSSLLSAIGTASAYYPS